MSETTVEKIEPWPVAEAAQMWAMARQCMRCEMHDDHDEYRQDCSGCVLSGYLSDSAIADGRTEFDGPNYCGWGRVYVEARRAIPSKWADAFLRDQLNSDNRAYAAALARSIATFGLHIDDK